ncbi:hypothetical protein AB0N05_04385 [Nocardia sp. NPDC051030]|uniref:phthiocerol/phthiodiolone dimycocerosyl transferase family protein n=1 Tax=Nocardia sp. NPDC051030 TaxID=3155162 RepID=UPI00341D475D
MVARESPVSEAGSVTAATGFGRRLSPSERWFWIIDQISPANCCVRVRVTGALSPEQLERGAAAVMAEYPLLRAGVVDPAGGDPRLVALDAARIPVRRVETVDPQRWRAEIDAELVEPLEVRAGLARIVDVASGAGTAEERHDLIVTISHLIIDGRSLLTVLRKLIEYAVGNGDSHADMVVGRAAVPPSDDLIPVGARGFWRYVYTTLFDQAAALVLRPQRLTGAVPLALPERRTKLVHRVIRAEELAPLVADCRRAGVTVHGALAAAVARAIGHTVRPGGRGVAGIGSPVDFRGELEPVPDAAELGIYAPVLAGFVRFGPEISLWDMARSVNRQVERGVRQRRHLSTVAGMRFGTPRTVESGRRLVELIDRRASWNVSVTNVGRVEFPEHIGALRISSLVLTGSNSCVSAMTVAISTAHDEMQLSFCYVDGVLTARQAEDFADHVLGALADRPADL